MSGIVRLLCSQQTGADILSLYFPSLAFSTNKIAEDFAGTENVFVVKSAKSYLDHPE
jgi:hypothetical protein